MPSQPGLVSGCRLDYTSSAGSASKNVTQLSTSSRIAAVSCDNQTISYTGTAYDSMLRALGCSRSGVTKCPFVRGNTQWKVAHSLIWAIEYILYMTVSVKTDHLH